MVSRFTAVLSLLAVFLLQSSTVAQKTVAKKEADVSVTLIQQGAAPHETIRYQPEKGATQDVIMSMDMQQAISVGGNTMPSVPIPTQEFTIAYKVVDVAGDGTTRLEFEYTDVEVLDDSENPSPAAAQLEQSIAPLKGLTGYAIMDNRGFTLEADIDVPDDLPPMMKSIIEGTKHSLKSLSNPMPAEPVGKGAKWKVVQNMTMNGLQLTQTMLFTLDEIDGDRYQLSAVVGQAAEPQDVKSPMLPPGATMRLESLKTSGSAQLVLKRSSVVPLESSTQIKTQSAMTVSSGGDPQPMTTDMTMKMSLRPK